jgi:galactose-1-phosphate uridylyltransferase
MSDIQNVLDSFLESYFYATDLANRGANKETHARADQLLGEKETSLLNALNLDLGIQTDSDTFDRILELAGVYREGESEYETLVNYVESLAAATN